VNDTVYAAIAAVTDSSPQNPGSSPLNPSGIRRAGMFLGDLNNAGQLLAYSYRPVNLEIPFTFVTDFLLMIAVGVAYLGSISVTAGAVDPTVPNRLASVRRYFRSGTDLVGCEPRPAMSR
jgi:hypothetical protein